jgi:hypothetical protein
VPVSPAAVIRWVYLRRRDNGVTLPQLCTGSVLVVW